MSDQELRRPAGLRPIAKAPDLYSYDDMRLTPPTPVEPVSRRKSASEKDQLTEALSQIEPSLTKYLERNKRPREEEITPLELAKRFGLLPWDQPKKLTPEEEEARRREEEAQNQEIIDRVTGTIEAGPFGAGLESLGITPYTRRIKAKRATPHRSDGQR